jgi:hypothetical protein
VFKKAITSVFILTANIILLLHAVFPHHHHESQVCFTLSHGNSCEVQIGTEPDHHSGNDANGDTEDCVLKRIVALPDKTSFRVSDSPEDTFQILLGDATLPFDQQVYVPIPNWVPLDPFIETFSFSYLVSSSLGLRAPPAV